MKTIKRIIAITLCLSLVFISSSYVQVSAKYDHTAYINRIDNYFSKKKVYSLHNTSKLYDRVYDCEGGGGFIDFGFVLGKNKKSINNYFKKLLKILSKEYSSFSYLSIKKPNKKTLCIVAYYGHWYSILVCKVNTKKCRVVVGGRDFNHKPKKKRIKKAKKWLYKTVNKLNSF